MLLSTSPRQSPLTRLQRLLRWIARRPLSRRELRWRLLREKRWQ